LSLDPDCGDSDILDVIQQWAKDRSALDRYLDAAKRIREGVSFSKSIDAFIDVHRDDKNIQQLGKLAIAKTILEQEKRCHMFIAPPGSAFQDAPKLNETWFVKFVRGLNEGVRKEEVDRIFEKVSFIVFNYDRCVEHLLYNALQQHYGIDTSKAQSVMNSLTILRPYGKVANLPWQESDGGIPFGFPPNRANMLMMEGRIQTYTEQRENIDTLAAIRREVAQAETLVFVGFSYLDLNMNVLDPGRECAVRHVFGTSFGMSEHDVEKIKDQIRRLVRRSLMETTVRGGERLYIRFDLRCAGLLEEYSRSLFAVGQRGGS
jgi:hypothetical protein